MTLQELRDQLDTLNDWMISAPPDTPAAVLDAVEIAIHCTTMVLDKRADEAQR